MAKLLMYCCKSKPDLVEEEKELYEKGLTGNNKYNIYNTNERGSCGYTLNGYIVAECDFETEEIRCASDEYEAYYYTESLLESDLLKRSCLSEGELGNYLLFVDNSYAIHIKNLHIFDKPRELSQYHRPYGCINISCERKTKKQYLGCSLVRHCKITQIKKAPQNMMKVESKICDEKDYILISIRPEYLVKILNGEQTILVRKKVLKEMF